MGHKSASGPHTRFTQFRVPSSQLLAPPESGAAVVEQTFAISAAIVGSMCVGIMRAAFEAALAYAKKETRGGTVKIIERQSVADKLIDIKTRIDAGRMLTWKAMGTLENGPGGWESRLEACLESKIWCGKVVTRSVLDAMEVVGM